MSGSDNQPPKDHRRKSRLPRYLNDTQERLDELRSELDDQLSMAGSDEGYPGSPHGSPRRPKSRGNPMDKLIDTTNMVILSNLPDVPYPKEVFAHDTLAECHIAKDSETPVVKRSKRDDMLFIYDLSDADQKSLVSFMRKHHPEVSSEPTMGVPPFRHMEDTTEMILNILRSNQREQMSYTEIYEQAPDAYLFLTDDFPYDTNRLVEIKRTDFYGMRVKEMVQKQGLDRRHLMCLINVRSLAPLVHGMISIEPRLLDRNFLEDLRQRILENASQILSSAIYALAVDGEALKKPLEHLVTCVPGVEVIWTANRKVIRKLELPERAITEPAPRSQAAQNAPADAMRQEQEAVKILSDILKKPSNLYMTLTDLEIALRKSSVRVERNLRQFITERPKHFQILGEDDYEVVTLSHRAQIKRVCNDLQKVLRPRKPKCISSADIAAAFANHWRTANEQDRRFNVEDFGVCFLDDLLVTIPQHWGVHCSEYVSTDGAVVRRTYGRGEEEIPDFVPRDPKDRVYAWIPRHHQTEVQRKALALLKQQVLNMFRGDPSAEALIGHLTHQNRGHGPEHNRLIRLAYLRANRPSGHQGVPHHGRDNPALPCNFEMEEKTFVPLYHRFCGEQVALINFGVKDLFELFDSMQDTFIASGHGQERTISLTSDARREILERRLIDVLRMAKKPLTLGELLQTYRRHATMTPYFDEFELKRALGMSQLVERSGGGHLFAAKPFFRYKRAVALQPDVAHVLLIFMLSYAPLDVATIANKFLERTGRRLDESILRDLENAGAIRLVTEFEQLYDLHDICRVVRNLVYKMNELPSKIYGVELQHCLVPNQPSSREVPIASLLSFTGDYTYFPPEQLLSIMHDFEICFEALGQTQFRLRQELMVWVPAPEEVEASQGRRGARGAHQAHRGVTQSRRGARGAHQGHRGGNRGRQT